MWRDDGSQIVISGMLYFSRKARDVILCELDLYPDLETGGILLGQIKVGNLYVKEVVCGGENAIHEPARFRYDSNYVEREIEHIMEKHNFDLQMIGLWHKHNHTNEPAFSKEDINMHQQLLDINKKGISCLFQKREDGKYQMQILDNKLQVRRTKKIW